MFILRRIQKLCPDLYEVYCRKVYVGRLEILGGKFTARCKGEIVYSEPAHGSQSSVPCLSDDERESQLTAACLAMKASLQPTEPLYMITGE